MIIHRDESTKIHAEPKPFKGRWLLSNQNGQFGSEFRSEDEEVEVLFSLLAWSLVSANTYQNKKNPDDA